MRTFHITPTALHIRNKPPGNSSATPPKREGSSSEGYKLNVSKIKKMIWLWFCMKESSEGLFFYTISFPLATPDNIAHKLFNSVLTNLRKHQGLINYLWITERQGNGTIHYHMFVGEVIKVQKFNKAVRSALLSQLKKGFLTNITEEEIGRYNGVHISKNKGGKVQNFHKLTDKKSRQAAINYITKYITKPERDNQAPFLNLRWHCSRSISALQLSYSIRDEAEINEILESQAIDQSKFFETDWGTIIFPFQQIPVTGSWRRYIQEQEFLFKMSQPKNKETYEDFKATIRIYSQKKVKQEFEGNFSQ